jgi:CheY-like chemotaxis protein
MSSTGRRTPLSRSSRADAGSGTTVIPRRVLIVEDEALIAMSLEAMVEDIGHHVVGLASSLDDAVRLALQHGPDLVLMDVRLGSAGDEGIVAARAIRDQTDAAVIFVTAYAGRALATQLDAILPGTKMLAKPVEEPLLAAAIEEVMHKP